MNNGNKSFIEIALNNKDLKNSKSMEKDKVQIRKKIEKIIEEAQILPYAIEVSLKENEYNPKLRPNTMTKRERTKWSEVETFYLKKGISLYGAGKWTKIHTTYKEHFHPSRRPADLKDKYKIISKNTEVNPHEREYIQVDKYGRKMNDQIYKAIYPREVAMEVAKGKGVNDETLYIADKSFFKAEEGSYSRIYPYLISILEGKLVLKRLI